MKRLWTSSQAKRSVFGRLGSHTSKNKSPRVQNIVKLSPEVATNKNMSPRVQNIVKTSPVGSYTTKIAVPGLIGHGEKEKPQVRGCRTLVQRGTGRQDSPGRGDGLGWTTSTPPDSNGVPRDVPDSPELCTHSTKMSVFWAHQRKSSASIGSQTGGKSAHRSKNQPNPGLIGQDVRKSLTGRR